MKFLFAPDALKGSLTSAQAAGLLEKAARAVFEQVECFTVPVADGGEGTMEAVLAAEGGRWMEAEATGPLGEKVKAKYGALDERRAVIEMAQASGLPLVPPEKRNPLYTTTFGTGELIRNALDHGFSDLSVAIGGSATNDGGMGCMRALGARFLDKAGRELAGRGEDLERVEQLDFSGLDGRLRQIRLTVLCDVNNPLCGENGAVNTFSAQKGATEEIKRRLEAGMVHYRDVIKKQLGIDPDTVPGSGAAGGLGAALSVFLGGVMRSGIDTVLDLIHEPYAKELFPAGRLDRDTEGLLLLTSDGKMSHELLSPKKHVEKTYYVVIDGTPDPEMVERFREGLEIGEKKPTLPAGMVFLDTDQEASGEAITGTIESISAADLKRCGKEECCAIVTITEGKFHQIKRMFRAVGRQVHFLKRIAVGNLWLDPTLAPGQYRPLTEEELDLLKNSPPGQSLS